MNTASESIGNGDCVRTNARRRPHVALLLAVVTAALGMAAYMQIRAAGGLLDPQGDVVPLELDADQIREVEAMTVGDTSQIMAEGAEAQQRNAAIAVSAKPVEHVSAFVLPKGRGGTYATALKCLAQTVYYEAANEPIEGRRAVAQVVLNRVRHPAYPNSICGVVYEGSQLATGCQFSFTCDGSLLRTPVKALWRQSEDVARKALAGHVQTGVGTATNYHADYVLPKWAFELAKVRKVGRHIFYRLHGRLGQTALFRSAYGGVERIPTINFDVLRGRLLARAQTADEPAVVPGLSVPPAVTDRHAANDVGGRLDVSKTWRLSIPDPVTASSKYRTAIADAEPAREKVAAAPAAHPMVAVQ